MSALLDSLLDSTRRDDCAAADRANDREIARAVEAFAGRTPYDAKAEQIKRIRPAVDAIKAIPVWARTPAAYAHLMAILSSEIGKSGFGHTVYGQDAQASLDGMHDYLDAVEE